jgi:ABC-2 type transport system permease protein
MKHVIAITLKDIRETMRDRMTFMFLLAMPVVFTLMFGFAFGGTPADTRPVVGWLDQDNSRLSAAEKDLLLAAGAVRLDETAGRSPAELEKLVADGKLAAALVVPAGYEESARVGQLLKLTVFSDPSSAAGAVAQAAIQAAARRAASAAVIAQGAQQATGAGFDGALQEALAGWQQPPVSLEVANPAAPAPANPMTPSQTAPGLMVQFAMAGLITSAQVLVYERKSRCLPRQLTTAVARWQILLGHYLAIFAVIFTQLVLLVAFGQLVFGLDYLGQPAATLVMVLATALFMAALGLLIGTLAKSDEQAILFSMIPMFVFSALGGAWVPLENTGQVFQVVGHFTPVAWAMDGFKGIVARGLGLPAVWLPAAALLGYAALCAALAVWKFKFE